MKTPYFSHDQNARNDPKITKIRVKYGMEGYGCYFALLEMFSSQSDCKLEYSTESFEAIAYDLRLSFNMQDFVDKCIEIGLFVSDGRRFWSEPFNRRYRETIEKAAARSAAASKGAAKKWEKWREKNANNSDMESIATTEQQEQERDIPDPRSLDSIDPNWLQVAKCYEQNIGLLPMGVAAGELISYCDDLGPDVMCKAIEITNRAQPDNPKAYLNAILRVWAEKGIATLEKAQAEVVEHERKITRKKKRNDELSKDDEQAPYGKFY